MIVDCFTFADEFDMLELRLRTLEHCVDRFVICEAPFTFRGDPKPLHFAQNAERFARWSDRIVPLVYPGPPEANPWLNEWAQRDFLGTALDGCAPDDVILIGDCDELPDPDLVARRPAAHRALVHRMLLARGFVNRLDSLAYDWPGTRALAAGDIARFGRLSDVRKIPLAELDAVEGGWHFSSLGDTGAQIRKMQSYAHAEYDIAYYCDVHRLDVERASGEWVPLDERFPLALRTGERWAHLVAPQPPSTDAAELRRSAHAHGCLAYVPEVGASIAVLSATPEAWRDVLATRPGLHSAGVYTDAATLVASAPAGSFAIVDAIERHSEDTLAQLAAARLSAIVFATNARSFTVFQRVVSGHAGFDAGRALGRSEVAIAATNAGYHVAACDRVYPLTLSIPYAIPPGYDMSLGSFAFPRAEPEAIFDFLAQAFVFVLTSRTA